MTVRRILVALDASPGSRAAAEATARLAARLQAELIGLFVEDDRVLRLAESPLAREVDTLTARRRLPEGPAARRQLRLQGARARDELRRIAEREGVAWSFRVTRGSVSTAIAEAAEEADIVGLGPVGWSHRPQRVLGRAATAVIERRKGSTLLLRRSVEVRSPIVVVFDDSEPAKKALTLAGQLTDRQQAPIEVYLVEASEEVLEKALSHAVEDPRRAVVVGQQPRSDTRRLVSGLVAVHPGTLLFPHGAAATVEDELRELLDRLDCPVLLVS